MPDFDLAPLDLVILGGFTLMIIGIGIWAGRKADDGESYFLAGRGMTWPLVGFSLIATQFSGTQFLGLAGGGWETGIPVYNYEWMAVVVLVFFALFILPIYLQSRIQTVPEFLEKRYDKRSRKVFSAFNVFTAMFIDSAGAMFAGALVLSLLFPDVPMLVHIIIIALLGGGYVILGGLRAVMVTDTIQGVLLYLAAGLLFVIVFAEFDFDWSIFPELAPEGGFTLAPPADDDFFPWPGLFTGAIWLGFFVWVTNHIIVQRVLAAKSLDHGRWGALFAAVLQLPLLVLLIFPGIMARDIFDDLDSPDLAWPALVFEYLPVGVRGIVVAALLAALMSTLDSVLNGSAHLVVSDFMQNGKRKYSDRQVLVRGRLLVALFMVIAVLWAPVLLTFDTLVEYFQSFFGYVTMPVVVVLLGGIFWRRATAQASFWTIAIVGPIGFVGFLVGEIFVLHDVQFLYATGIMLLISLVTWVGISLATPAPATASLREVTFDRTTWRQESQQLKEKPFYRSYRFWSLMVLLLTAAIVVPLI